MVTVSSSEAQNSFGQWIDKAQQEIIAVTRDGRTAAYLVSPEELEELQEFRRRSRAVAALEAWSLEADRNQTPEQREACAQLTQREINRMVHELR